jgi:hypothetical protein
MTTAAELAAVLRTISFGQAVIYCHPLDYGPVRDALGWLPAELADGVRLESWNGAQPGQVYLVRAPAGRARHGGPP